MRAGRRWASWDSLAADTCRGHHDPGCHSAGFAAMAIVISSTELVLNTRKTRASACGHPEGPECGGPQKTARSGAWISALHPGPLRSLAVGSQPAVRDIGRPRVVRY